MKSNEFVIEADRIGTALWKNSVPPRYKQFPVIGQGATSVVLDKGDGTVLVLTRDAMKKDWLVHGLRIGNWIETFDTPHRKIREMGELPVFVIQMPRLFPLSLANKRIINNAITQYRRIVSSGQTESHLRSEKFNDYLDAHPDGLFAELVNFLGNYDPSQYTVDFLIRNFMQDKDGGIVLIDPIVAKELVDLLYLRFSDRRY